MGIMDKLQFWKKKDDLMGDLGKHDSLPPLKSDIGGSNPLPQDNPLGRNNAMSDFSVDSNFVQPLNKGGMEQPNQPMQQQTPPDITTAFAPPQQEQNYPTTSASVSAGYVNKPQMPNHDSDLLRKEMEVISSKLDYLKASLETINKRLDSIENLSRYEYGQNQRKF